MRLSTIIVIKDTDCNMQKIKDQTIRQKTTKYMTYKCVHTLDILDAS